MLKKHIVIRKQKLLETHSVPVLQFIAILCVSQNFPGSLLGDPFPGQQQSSVPSYQKMHPPPLRPTDATGIDFLGSLVIIQSPLYHHVKKISHLSQLQLLFFLVLYCVSIAKTIDSPSTFCMCGHSVSRSFKADLLRKTNPFTEAMFLHPNHPIPPLHVNPKERRE